MSVRDLRLLHRVAVDWTADTFGLRGGPSGPDRNAAAAVRAGQRHERMRARGQAAARALPARLHQSREPRVLRGWQTWIAGRAHTTGSRP